jgi:anti-sigma factor RsiW
MDETAITDEELNAFVDGELDDERARRVAGRVSASPALSDRVALLRQDKDLLARVYGPLAERPVPPRLLRAIDRSRDERRRRQWGLLGAAAVAAGIVMAVWFGAPASWFGDRLVNEAMAARDGTLAPTQDLAAASEAETAQVVAAALPVPVKVPDLNKAGYALAAVAVYPARGGGHSLQLTYRDGQGRRFTVYLHRPTGPDRFNLLKRANTQVCVWQNDDLGVVMAGEMSPTEMLRVAALTYADLNL